MFKGYKAFYYCRVKGGLSQTFESIELLTNTFMFWAIFYFTSKRRTNEL